MGARCLQLSAIVYLCLFPLWIVCAPQSDSTSLIVSIATPPAGRIIAGSVLVSATASAPIVGVQFKLDDQNLGEVITAPFSTVWNTNLASNGPHMLTAIARDSAGTRATSVIMVTVDNTLGFLPPAAAGIAYAFPGTGAQSWTSSTNSSPPQVGYARILADPISVTPFGVAIVGLRNGDVLVGETGIPGTLPMKNGRFYVELNDRVNTGLAFANPNDADAVISLSFSDKSGTNLGNHSFTLRANQQVVAFLNQNPFNYTGNGEATLTFTAGLPVSVVALRGLSNELNDLLISALPILNLEIPNGTEQAVLPHFVNGGGWRTQIVLLNSTDVPISGNVEFFGQGQLNGPSPALTVLVDGVSNSRFQYAIAPRGFVRMAMDGGIETTQIGSVHVTAAQHTVAPSTFAIVSLTKNGRTVSEAGIASVSPSLVFRTYVQSTNPLQNVGSIETGVAIANPSSTPVEANLELVNLAGTSIGLSTTVTVGPRGQVARFVRELFPQLSYSFEGLLKLKSTSPLVMTALRARINERSDLIFTTTPAANAETFTNPEITFPIIVSGGGFNTQFVLLGISGEPAISGRVLLLSSSGTVLPATEN